MNSEINKALTTPTMKDYFAVMGVTPGGGTPEEFGELLIPLVAFEACVLLESHRR